LGAFVLGEFGSGAIAARLDLGTDEVVVQLAKVQDLDAARSAGETLARLKPAAQLVQNERPYGDALGEAIAVWPGSSSSADAARWRRGQPA
jgi:hypothetical protein